MSQDLGVPAAVAAWLSEREIPALSGWRGMERKLITAPTSVVTLREYAALPAGFEHYLGERYNEETAAWEEIYGRKVELTLGLDLYAPEMGCGEDLQGLLERLTQALTLGAPAGLQVERITCGQTRWDESQRLLKREVSAVCTAWLVAVCPEGAEFLDFELRGGWNI